MSGFKLFWNLHKWTGIVLSAVILTTAVTGLLLLIKKRADWIQPPTQTGAAGAPADFISIDVALGNVLALEHPDFTALDDVDRIDVRVDRRVLKVRSNHNHAEVQVCAVTGEVLSVATRPSDVIETIHDGSFFADWVHDWVMPLYAAALTFLVFSGWWLWLEPKVRRRRRLARDSLRRQMP